MLVDTEIYVKITSNMCKYYINKGYQFKCNDTILVKVVDLPQNSNQKVKVQCDICREIYELSLCDYNKNIQKNSQYICKKCKNIAYKRTCLLKYGVDNVFKKKEYQEKQKETCLLRYGVDNVFKAEIIKDKIKNTMVQKYGFTHPMYVPSIKDKTIHNAQQTRLIHNNQICSKQQQYIANIYNGVINYLYDIYWLDIYFPDKNIYCEYNGSGHDIPVRYNRMSEKDFYNKEKDRYLYLLSKGLKGFFIISKTDYIPDVNILIQMKEFAFQILINNDYIVFDIDNNNIYYKNNNIYFNFKQSLI